jgi:hypothetical protein
METTHSKTGRTKGSAPKIVVPSWDSLWESFTNNNTQTTIEAMNAEGWRSVDQVMSVTGLSNSRIYNMIREGKFDCEKKRIKKDGGPARILSFVRPKVTTSQ